MEALPLCFTCNAAMGMFDHDPVLLIEAAEYLLAFAEPDDDGPSEPGGRGPSSLTIDPRFSR